VQNPEYRLVAPVYRILVRGQDFAELNLTPFRTAVRTAR
jgi:hypothetical protein